MDLWERKRGAGERDQKRAQGWLFGVMRAQTWSIGADWLNAEDAESAEEEEGGVAVAASVMRLAGRHKHRRPELRRSMWHGQKDPVCLFENLTCATSPIHKLF